MINLLKILSTEPVIEQVNTLQQEINALKPINPEMQQRIMSKLRLDWNYHSNAIEGNKLDYGETVALLMEGVTAKGKPLKDQLDIKGHNEAINFLLDVIKENRTITEADVRQMHKVILVEPYEVKTVTTDGSPSTKMIRLGEYKKTPNHVKTATGETHFYATPEETPIKMQELMQWYNEAEKDSSIHPLAIASVFHHRFTAIHPFDDGNGRMARLLMNLILMRKEYPPVVIKRENRETYYGVLAQADAGNDKPLLEFIGENLVRSLEIYLTGAKGGDINEASDIDKEISLFKASLDKPDHVRLGKNQQTMLALFDKLLDPLFMGIYKRLNQLQDLFVQKEMLTHYTVGGRSVATNFDLSDLKKRILTQNKLIENLTFTYTLKGFKKSTDAFKTSTDIIFLFNDFHYQLESSRFNKRHIGPKLYDDFLTSTEINELVSEVVRSVMQEIERKSQNKA